MTEQAQEYSDADFLDPSKFQEMLDAEEVELEQEDQEAEDGEQEIEVEVELEGDNEDDSDDEESEFDEETEEEQPEDDSVAKSVKHFKDMAKAEAEEKAILQHKYNELVQLIESKLPSKPKEEPNKFEPLDEEADKKYNEEFKGIKDELAEEKAQREVMAFQAATAQAHTEARTKYADFDQAFEHYKQSEVRKFTALGHPEKDAQELTQEVSSKIAHRAWQGGQNLGDLFYDFAQAAGYKPEAAKEAPKKPKGINVDALAKNKARTEKKSADTVNPTSSHGDLMKRMNGMAKLGSGVSDKDFRDLLKQATS